MKQSDKMTMINNDINSLLRHISKLGGLKRNIVDIEDRDNISIIQIASMNSINQ